MTRGGSAVGEVEEDMSATRMTCLVVGVNSSIGRAVFDVFRAEGHKALGTTRSKVADDADVYELNPADDVQVRNVIDGFEKLDAVIFCTGYLPGKALSDYAASDLELVFEANVMAPMKVLNRLADKLNANCSVLFVGSIAGSAGSFDEGYAASKSALVGLTKSLAKKSRNGVRYNCISPALVDGSSMHKTFNDEIIANHIKQTPTGKLLTLSDLARVCYDLCQPHWNQLNGQIIDINGGRYV